VMVLEECLGDLNKFAQSAEAIIAIIQVHRSNFSARGRYTVIYNAS
jgi:hypothetical protein